MALSTWRRSRRIAHRQCGAGQGTARASL